MVGSLRRGRAVIQAGLTVTRHDEPRPPHSVTGDQLFQITYSSQCGLRSGVSGVPAERRLSSPRPVSSSGWLQPALGLPHVLGPVPTLGHIPPAR